MGNPIKYSTSVTSGSYQKGNVAVGVNPISYGPTSTTGWYNSPTPTGGNFIVTEVVDGNTPPRFYAPTTDAEWIRLAQQEGATGANTGSVSSVKSWFASQANYVITNIDFPTSLPSIVGNGLVLNLDAKINSSYPGSGTTWTDISGLGNNATLVNSPSFNSGEEAIIFDGADDYGYISNTANINWGNQISVGVLFYNRGGDYRGLINQGYYYPTGWEWRLGREDSGRRLGGFIQNTSNVYVYSEFLTNLNRWNFIYLTYDGSSVKGYLNGVLQTTAPQTGNIKISSYDVCIGMRGLDNPGEYFNDGIQIAQIYNRALTQDEILQNYYQSNIVTNGLIYAVDASNLVSYESGSTIAYSLTGSLTGSLINGTSYSTSNGGTWNFDGIDDYMITQQITGYKSLCFWVYWTGTGPQSTWQYLLDARTGMNAGWFVPSATSMGSDWNTTFYVNGVSTSTLNSTTVPKNQWLHIYLEGVNASYTSTINFMSRYTNDEQAGGKIGGIYVYNRSLSVSEIQQNFNAQRSRFGI